MKKSAISMLFAALACLWIPMARGDALDAKISEDAIMRITPKNSPKTVAKWGPAYIEKINGLQRQAARKAAASNRCDKVVWVSLSDRRSTVKKEAVFLVQCRNDERFFISENELGSSTTAKSVQQLGERRTDSQYIDECKACVDRALGSIPQLHYSYLAGGTSVYRAPGTGNVVARVRIATQKEGGPSQLFEASCTYNSGKMIDVDVRNLNSR